MAKGTKSPKKLRIGVVDTMFARYDMGASARAELAECPGYGERFSVVSRTVPGFKDLAVAAKSPAGPRSTSSAPTRPRSESCRPS
jgi:hypothetical protein